MKLMDIFKTVFGSKLDEEIDIDLDESTVKENEKDSKLNSDKDEEKNDTSENNDKDVEVDTDAGNEKIDSIKLFEDGWYDEASGLINFEKIKNEEALKAIKTLADKYKVEKDARLISDNINDTLKGYSLNVSEEHLRKVLDITNVKIDDTGKVVGVKEAIESLKKSEPGLFKDITKESSPLNEGFNPVEKQSAYTESELIQLAYGQGE